MNYIFLDIGIKNFCYLVCNIDSNIITLNNTGIIEIKNTNKNKLIKEVIQIIKDLLIPDLYFCIESQPFQNPKCQKIEYIILTYCESMGYNYKSINPKDKYKILNIKYSNYYDRKKKVVIYGEKILNEKKYKNYNIQNNIEHKISNFSKLDDFYDCFLMCITL